MKPLVLFIYCPILLNVIGEFLIKVSSGPDTLGFSSNNVLSIVTNGGIILGVASIFLAAVLWIIGMSKFQLSYMYPYLSLTYVLIILGSDILLKEDVSINRYVALACIVIGILIMSKSPNVKAKELSNESNKSTI